MISRLSTCATVFALAATTALALTVQARQPQTAVVAPAAKPVRIVELPHVVVVGHRLERSRP